MVRITHLGRRQLATRLFLLTYIANGTPSRHPSPKPFKTLLPPAFTTATATMERTAVPFTRPPRHHQLGSRNSDPPVHHGYGYRGGGGGGFLPHLPPPSPLSAYNRSTAGHTQRLTPRVPPIFSCRTLMPPTFECTTHFRGCSKDAPMVETHAATNRYTSAPGIPFVASPSTPAALGEHARKPEAREGRASALLTYTGVQVAASRLFPPKCHTTHTTATEKRVRHARFHSGLPSPNAATATLKPFHLGGSARLGVSQLLSLLPWCPCEHSLG